MESTDKENAIHMFKENKLKKNLNLYTSSYCKTENLKDITNRVLNEKEIDSLFIVNFIYFLYFF